MAEVIASGDAIPKIVAIIGHTGAGKTTGIGACLGAHDAVLITAWSDMSLPSMLRAIAFELGVDGGRSKDECFTAIVRSLKDSGRALFVDEADYLSGKMLMALRDIHDAARVPVIVVGMENFERKLSRYPQFAGRVSQRVEFKACDLADAALLTKDVCEVGVAPDLVKAMHGRTKGHIRLMTVALAHFESMALDNGWKAINAETWGGRPMFLGDKKEA
jgi:DNA transposition AAA+ family ATPase